MATPSPSSLKKVQAKGFSLMPWLETSQLMQSHPGGVKLSAKKPNVIVGPNGAGKSAFLQALAMATLAYYTGKSALDRHFLFDLDRIDFWSRERSWGSDFEFLKGLTLDGTLGLAAYYHPGRLPGNEDNIATAMMCGYFESAKAVGRMIDNKSAGQQCAALLAEIVSQLEAPTALSLGHENWGLPLQRKQPKEDDFRASSHEVKVGLLQDYAQRLANGHELLLLDEPEQSLDTLTEVLLWKKLAAADCTKKQIIVATHSLYPLMHPKSFNLIEAVEGYKDQVLGQLG